MLVNSMMPAAFRLAESFQVFKGSGENVQGCERCVCVCVYILEVEAFVRFVVVWRGLQKVEHRPGFALR